MKINGMPVKVKAVNQQYYMSGMYGTYVEFVMPYDELAGKDRAVVTESGYDELDGKIVYVNSDGDRAIFYGMMPELQGGVNE